MTPDNYIKMAEQAEEIQKAWRQENGDLVFWKITKSIKIITDHFFAESFKDFVWLPTIEQLFEIVLTLKEYKQNIKDLNWYMIFNDIEEFTEECWKFYSVQEIILAFVMYEKYSKIWTGEKWEVTNE